MKLICEITLDNEAFSDSPFDEINRAFKSAIARLAVDGLYAGNGKYIIDLNGNRVGKIEIEE